MTADRCFRNLGSKYFSKAVLFCKNNVLLMYLPGETKVIKMKVQQKTTRQWVKQRMEDEGCMWAEKDEDRRVKDVGGREKRQ